MPNTPELSEAKRALLEKYLRGDFPRTPTIDSNDTQRARGNAVSLSSTEPRVPLVVVNSEGSKRPFFYLHVHAEGGAFYCFTLAHDLGPDQPFYILDPYRFDGLPFLPTLEAMAAAYIESMRSIQPEGPYLLGGFCGGGLIAYEMAQQLLKAGQTVDLLLLIEPVDGPAPLKYITPRLTSSFVRALGKLVGFNQDKQLDWFLYLRHWPRLRHADYRSFRNFSLFPKASVLRQEWLSMFVWVISAYVPKPYLGKATYLWASKNPAKFRAWWGNVAKAQEVEIHVMHGTHESCRRAEHIHEMGDYLRKCLSNVQV